MRLARSLGRQIGHNVLDEVWIIARKGVFAFIDDDALSRGAAIAFYAVTGFVPALVLSVALLGAVFGPEVIRGVISHSLHVLVGDEAEALMAIAVKNTAGTPGVTGAEIFGAAVLIVTTSGAFSEIQAALNVIWKVHAPGFTMAGFLRARVTSLILVLAFGMLLLASILVTIAIATWAPHLHFELGTASALLPLADFLFSLALATVLFAAIYKILPDIDLKWSDVVVGAFLTALLYELGQLLIGLYFESRTGFAQGTTGGMIVLLLWIYYSVQVFLLGAEFTKIYATRHSPAQRFQAIQATQT